MPSPVGHALGGLVVSGRLGWDWSGVLLVIFIANLPDLDFLPGALVGDLNRYHHMGSHSVFAAVLCGVCFWWVGARWQSYFRLSPQRLAMSATLVYLSHLALDSITIDRVAPHGMQLWWPFSEQYVIAPITFLVNVDHGGLGDSLFAAIGSIFSWHNLGAIGLEVVLILPLVLLIKWYSRRQRTN